MRFMSIITSAHFGPPTPELMEAMGKLADREIKAGRMIDSGGLMPVATGAQVRITDGKLSVVERLGSETYAYVDVPQVGSITVRAEGDFERRAGRDICIRLDLTHAHVFDANDVAIHHPPRV